MLVHFGLTVALYLGRQYDSAIEHAARALEINANFPLVHFALGMAQFQKGALRESIASFERVLELAPSFSQSVGFLAATYARAGHRDHAEKLIREFSENPKAYVSPICLALYHASLDEVDPMFEFLDASLANREPSLPRTVAEPLFDPFRSDPRYRALLSAMNLG